MGEERFLSFCYRDKGGRWQQVHVARGGCGGGRGAMLDARTPLDPTSMPAIFCLGPLLRPAPCRSPAHSPPSSPPPTTLVTYCPGHTSWWHNIHKHTRARCTHTHMHARTQTLLARCHAGTALALAILVPNIEYIFGLCGATVSVVISFIMPASIYLRVTSLQPAPGGARVTGLMAGGYPACGCSRRAGAAFWRVRGRSPCRSCSP